MQVGYESNPFAPDSQAQPYNTTAKALRERIDATLQAPGPGVLQVGGTYTTQLLDPMFMEPEAGLAWLDRAGTGTLNLVLGTQATNGDAGDSLSMFSDPGCPVEIKTVVLNSCYPGGGFGGRDVSTFPALLAVTAALADAPVRIAQDRYEQFQGGLKQLASSITHRIAVDAKSGQFLAFGSQGPIGAGRAVEERRKTGEIFVLGPFSPGQGQKLIKSDTISGGFMWNPKQAGEVFVTLADRMMKGESIKEGDDIVGLDVIKPVGNDIIVDQLLPINKDTVDELAAMGL